MVLRVIKDPQEILVLLVLMAPRVVKDCQEALERQARMVHQVPLVR